MLFGRVDAPRKGKYMEKNYPECKFLSYVWLIWYLIYATDAESILQFPQLCRFPLNDHVGRRMAAYLRTNVPGRTFHVWLKFIPKGAEGWGKLGIPDGGDCIRCAAVVEPL
jgi:hypothetical protein